MTHLRELGHQVSLINFFCLKYLLYIYDKLFEVDLGRGNRISSERRMTPNPDPNLSQL